MLHFKINIVVKIGIHKREGSYSDFWIEYCEKKGICYQILNAYDNNIVDQLSDCDAFMWHYHHGSNKDKLFAKQLLFSLESIGLIVFPNFKTGWHFDDKVGQKYLFEAYGIKCAKTYVFYDKKEALAWVNSTVFPKVFKLRRGAGASHVYLIKSWREAIKFINKAFGCGFKAFSGWNYFKNAVKLYCSKTLSLPGVIKAFGRVFIVPHSIKNLPRESQYVYFQEFIPNDGYDFRLEIVGDKAIAMVRFVRKNDFRASGGHMDYFNHELITKEVINFGFEIADKLGTQSCALDIVRHKETKELFLIEISYCYGVDQDEFNHGYWDRDGILHLEKFNGLEWMVDEVIESVNKKQDNLKSQSI